MKSNLSDAKEWSPIASRDYSDIPLAPDQFTEYSAPRRMTDYHFFRIHLRTGIETREKRGFWNRLEFLEAMGRWNQFKDWKYREDHDPDS